jgi:hypothetical protein
MSEPFMVAVAGPARVGKTTLLTAILSDTEKMLEGKPVSIVPEEKTASRIRQQRIELRRAIEAEVFDAAALGGTQNMSIYEVKLEVGGDFDLEVPFRVLDYPGRWLNPDERMRSVDAQQHWPQCEDHIKNSIMLLLPIDAAVLMEAVTPSQKSAVTDLLGLVDVEAIARRWAKARSQRPEEPAVVVVAPLKCEKYFRDNGGNGREETRLKAQVTKTYEDVLKAIRGEMSQREVRVVYAPIDTYGCVQLMEAEWPDLGPDGPGHLEFIGRYRFRGRSPQISVKAAGTVMQELCRCIVSGRENQAADHIKAHQRSYDGLITRKLENKGFWGALGYYLGGEAFSNRSDRKRDIQEIAEGRRLQAQLEEAVRHIEKSPRDERVEVW